MKILFLFIFFVSPTIAVAQQIQLKGSIVDNQTNLPIAAATISIVEKNLFYPADNAGRFNINSSQLAITDSISFSCIGYQTKKTKIDDMQFNSVIQLAPLVNILKEVRVGNNAPPLVAIGNKAKFNEGITGFSPGQAVALYLAGSKNMNGKIQTVGFFLCDGRTIAKGGDATAPFRIKLYTVDTRGRPGKELTNDIIIVSGKKDRAWFDIDISPYHIQNPDSGIFVAFFVLDTGYYKMRKGYQDNHIQQYPNFATPRIGTTKQNGLSDTEYYGENTDHGWEWYEFPYPDWIYMIRATIAPE